MHPSPHRHTHLPRCFPTYLQPARQTLLGEFARGRYDWGGPSLLGTVTPVGLVLHRALASLTCGC